MKRSFVSFALIVLTTLTFVGCTDQGPVAPADDSSFGIAGKAVGGPIGLDRALAA